MALFVPKHLKHTPRLGNLGPAGHVSEATLEALKNMGQPEQGEKIWPIDTPIPDGLPDPGLWRVLLFPVAQKRVSDGGIIIPDEWLDTADWMHPLWKVAKVGNLVCKGPAWHGFSEEELEANRPKPGELWLCDPKQPRRFHFDGMIMIVVNDDQLWTRVDPEQVSHIQYRGMNL